MSGEVFYVMFICPITRKPARRSDLKKKTMSHAEFQNWLDENPPPTNVDCVECGKSHLIIAEQCFLEGDQPPA
jgi:hypothetical protein